MPKKHAEDFEYLSNNPNYVPDPEIEEFMEEEISRAPKDPELLAQRLRNSTSAAVMTQSRTAKSMMPGRFFLRTPYICSSDTTHTIGISFIVALPIVVRRRCGGSGQPAVSWLTLT